MKRKVQEFFGKYRYAVLSSLALTGVTLLLFAMGNFAHHFFEWLLLFLAAVLLYFGCINKKYGKRDWIILLAAFIFASLQIVGANFAANKTLTLGLQDLWNTIGLVMLSFALFKLLYHWIDNGLYKHFVIAPRKKLIVFFVLMGGILVCYLPCFLANFPAVYGYDGPIELYQALEAHVWDSHQPVLYTAFLSGLTALGNLLGGYAAGLAVYSVVCLLIFAACMAYTILRMVQYKIPRVIIVFSLCFIAFNPIFQVFAITTTKEMLFGAALLILFLFTMDLAADAQKFFERKIYVIRYLAVAILMCLLRNQGIYILLILIPFVFLIAKKYRLKSVALLASSVAVVYIFTGPISNALGIIPPKAVEALSVPLQQVARVININPDGVTEQEKEIVQEVIPEQTMRAYLPYISDPIKSGFDFQTFQQNPMRYIKAYLTIGARNMEIYIDSFLWGSIGYFYLGQDLYDLSDNMSEITVYLPENNDVMQWFAPETKNMFPIYSSYIDHSGTVLQTIPVVQLLVSSGTPFVLCLIALGYLFYKRYYRFIFPLLILLLYFATLVIGPVVSIRYALPLAMCIPCILSLPFVAKNSYRTSYNNTNASVHTTKD